MDSYENLSRNETSSKWVYLFIILAEIFGVTCIILLVNWRGIYNGGFDPSVSRTTELNLHTLLMFISMIFLCANTIMLFRLNCGVKKAIVKLAHATLHLVTIVIASVGIHYAFSYHGAYGEDARGRITEKLDSEVAQSRHGIGHDKYNHYQMYSLHSWLGITTIILFVIQWFFGFGSFLMPFCSTKNRYLLKPLHVYLGCFIFMFSVATTLTGITQLAHFDLGTQYEWMVLEGILANCFGLILMFFAGLVLFILSNDCFKSVESYELSDVSHNETTKLTH